MYTQVAEEALRRIAQGEEEKSQLQAQNARLAERLETYQGEALAAARQHAGLLEAGNGAKKRFLEAFEREIQMRRDILSLLRKDHPKLADKLQQSLDRLIAAPERVEQAILEGHTGSDTAGGDGNGAGGTLSSQEEISFRAKLFRSLHKELCKKRTEFDSRLDRHLPKPCAELRSLIRNLKQQSKVAEELRAENAELFTQLRKLVLAYEDTSASLHYERQLAREAQRSLRREKATSEGLVLKLALSKKRRDGQDTTARGRATGDARPALNGPLTPPLSPNTLADDQSSDAISDEIFDEADGQGLDGHALWAQEEADEVIESSDEEPNPWVVPEDEDDDDDDETADWNTEVHDDVQVVTGDRLKESREQYRSELLLEVRSKLAKSAL